jgi:hypothetical protein
MDQGLPGGCLAMALRGASAEGYEHEHVEGLPFVFRWWSRRGQAQLTGLTQTGSCACWKPGYGACCIPCTWMLHVLTH